MNRPGPILWLDLDGVCTDFRRAVISEFGVDCDRDDMKGAWPFISADPSFWRDLPEMADLDALWRGIRHLRPRVLSGGCNPLRPCAEAKAAWVRDHLGPEVPVVVTMSAHKHEFCRPGDILVDDRPDNIEAWRAAGGLGIQHRDAATTLAELAALGLSQGWAAQPYLLAAGKLAASNLASPSLVLEEDGRQALVDRFRAVPGPDGARMRLSCHHVATGLGASHAPLKGFYEVEVVGEVADLGEGLHLLAVSVDGATRRPDGGWYHVVFARSGTHGDPDAVIARAMRDGGVTPCSAPAVHARWRRPAAMAEAPAPKPRQEVVEDREDWRFPDGTEGVRVTRTKGDIRTVLHMDGEGRHHNVGGEPAIVSTYIPTGEVRFTDWYEHGRRVPAAAVTARPGP